MAGLLTAAALADWCNEVVVIDKDECADDAASVQELQKEVRHARVSNRHSFVLCLWMRAF